MDAGVLILVLMEYKNTEAKTKNNVSFVCLNPCSNGIQKYFVINHIDADSILS